MLFFARRYNLFHDIVIGYFIVIFIRVWLIRFYNNINNLFILLKMDRYNLFIKHQDLGDHYN